MLLRGKMRRALRIAVRLIVVILLLGPFDCLAGGGPRSHVADCCLKGRCVPTASSDACCKNSVPDRDQFAPSGTAEHSCPLIVIAAVYVPTLAPCSTFQGFADPKRHPPGIELTDPRLPLLI
jgi:hypothetical protein